MGLSPAALPIFKRGATMVPDRILRLGKNLYRADRNWLRLPANRVLGDVSDVAADGKGRILLLQREKAFLLVFSARGTLEDLWENEGLTDGHSISAAPDGRVIVVDRDGHRVVIFGPEGDIRQVMGDRGKPGRMGLPFNHPTHAALNAGGDLFVSDGYGNYSVHHFDPAGDLLHSWGRPGRGPGEFSTPHSILVDRSGRVLVADRENNRIQCFEQDGTFMGEMGGLFHPMSLAEDAEGLIYATDQASRMHVFHSTGEQLGSCRTFGTYAHGMALDQDGNIFTAEMMPNRVTKMEKIGEC